MNLPLTPLAEQMVANMIADGMRLELPPADVVASITWLLVECFDFAEADAAAIAREHVSVH